MKSTKWDALCIITTIKMLAKFSYGDLNILVRTLALITSWLLWTVAAFLTLYTTLARAGVLEATTHLAAVDLEYSKVMYWGATVMVVSLGASLFLIRHYFWFMLKRQVGIGFCILTFLFYGVMLFVPIMGFFPFIEGDRGILQWTNCASSLLFLIVGFPKSPPQIASSSAWHSLSEQKGCSSNTQSKAILIAAIACFGIAVASPQTTIQILKTKFPAKRLRPPSGNSIGVTTPVIVLSTALPTGWTVSEQSVVRNQNYLFGNRVLLRNADRKRTIIVSVVARKVEGEASKTLVGSWKSDVVDGLKSGYGDDIQNDGFSMTQLNGREVASLKSHAITANGVLNFLTEGWVEKGFPVTCYELFCHRTFCRTGIARFFAK